jgi:hypothetical protein
MSSDAGEEFEVVCVIGIGSRNGSSNTHVDGDDQRDRDSRPMLNGMSEECGAGTDSRKLIDIDIDREC